MSIEVTPRSQATDLYSHRYEVHVKQSEKAGWWMCLGCDDLKTAKSTAAYQFTQRGAFAVRIIDNQA